MEFLRPLPLPQRFYEEGWGGVTVESLRTPRTHTHSMAEYKPSA